MKQIISWFAENSVAANLLMLLFIVGGLISAFSIKVEVFPDAEPDLIRISVSYPGASPQEVEEGVVKPIEEKVAGLAGIERITSTSKEGSGTILIEVIRGWDTNELLQDVKSAVDRITNLPEEAERPVVEKVIRRYPVVSIAVYGSAPEKTLKKVGERLKDELEELPDITEVRLYAVRPEEIHIEVPKRRLERYHLTLTKLAHIISQESFDLAAGKITTPHEEVLLRSKGKLTQAKDYAKLPVLTGPDGRTITLGKIARVEDGFRDDITLAAYFQGQRTIVVQVFRVGNQNDLKISKEVRNFLKKFKKSLPAGVKTAIYFDTTSILKSRLDLLLKNLAIGMIFVVITLGVFLHFKLAFWVTMGIPVAFCFALWILPHFNVSINMISLFGFILVLGIVVDDAIVIGENIFRRRELGDPPVPASIKGTLEVYQPVIFSVLTTMAAFYPLLLGTGVVGKVIRHIPIVVILVLLGSLLEALFILPCHLAETKFDLNKKRRLDLINQKLKAFVEGPFKKLLLCSLEFRYITISLFLAVLMFSLALILGGRVKTLFFPRVEADQIDCYLTMPAGTPPEKTLQVARRIEEAGREVVPPQAMRYTLTMLGVQMITHGPRAGAKDISSNLAQITIKLTPPEKRKGISAVELAKKWRKKVGEIPEAESITFQSVLFNFGKDVEVNLYMENQKTLLKIVKELEHTLKKFPGVYDISDNFLPGKREIQIKLKPLAYKLGLNLRSVAEEVRAGFYGAEALSFQKGRDEVRVMVRLPQNEREKLSTIYEMKIMTPSGKMVPLKDVAELRFTKSYLSLHRADLKRVITISADVDEKITSAKEIRRILFHKILPQLKAKYPELNYSMEGAGKEHRKAFKDVMDAFIFAMFLIYVLLAVPLKSFVKPFIIMAAIPFGIIGAFWGHVILGKPICILSFFGIVGLAGVVVNDALILVDAIENLKKKGKTIYEAVVKAVLIRFRPVILTTLTTFISLVPMISEKSVQAQFLIPMAISLGFGVLFATFITLLFVPAAYLILEDFKKSIKL